MNLQPVTGRPFTCRCVCCGRPVNTAHETAYADLDGVPFTDYYCALDAGNARAAAMRTTEPNAQLVLI